MGANVLTSQGTLTDRDSPAVGFLLLPFSAVQGNAAIMTVHAHHVKIVRNDRDIAIFTEAFTREEERVLHAQ